MLKTTCPAPARPAATPATSVTAARILDAPLDQLLAENRAQVVDSAITDSGFIGAVIQHKSGEIVLAMPTGRSDLEHDTAARYLLAQVFDVGLPQLPAPFVTTEL